MVCAVPTDALGTPVVGTFGVGVILEQPFASRCSVLPGLGSSGILIGNSLLSTCGFLSPSSATTELLVNDLGVVCECNDLGVVCECNDLFACIMVGHSEVAEVMAAKVLVTCAADEVTMADGSEFAIATVVVEVLTGDWAVVLGVLRACVTRNLARCTDFVDPYKEISDIFSE